MKKRSLIVVLAILCIATSCFVSSTFAKFTTEASGTDKATVATWEFKQGDTAITNSIDFDLFAASAIADTKDAGEADDANVANGDSVAIVAPGTKGSVSFAVTNASQVTADYTITVVLNVVEGENKTACDFIVLTGGNTKSGTLGYAGQANASATITFDWTFAFEGDHNALAGKTVEATATITFTQAD